MVKSVLKILSLVGIWTISKNEDNKQETLTLLLYTCLDTAVYISIGVGYCLLLILRQSRASNKVILNGSHAFLFLLTLALGTGRLKLFLTQKQRVMKKILFFSIMLFVSVIASAQLPLATYEPMPFPSSNPPTQQYYYQPQENSATEYHSIKAVSIQGDNVVSLYLKIRVNNVYGRMYLKTVAYRQLGDDRWTNTVANVYTTKGDPAPIRNNF